MKQGNQKLERAMWVMLKIIAILLALLVILTILNVVKVAGEKEDRNKTLLSQGQTGTNTKPVLSADGPSEAYYYNISYEDKIIMAKVVFEEAATESFECKVAVAAVILNRYYSDVPYFDTESIRAVVTQPYQFASITDTTMDDLKESPDCMRAVEAACKGWDPTRAKFPEGALYFYAPALMPEDFQEGVEVLTIGKVNFHYDYKLYEK